MFNNIKKEMLEGMLKTIEECTALKRMEIEFIKACGNRDELEGVATQIMHLLIIKNCLEDMIAEGEEDE